MNQERSSLFLIANLGAEVSRIISFKEKNDASHVEESMARALHMIETIRKLPDMKSRLEEISLLRQAIVDVTRAVPTLRISPKHLMSYFQPFALRLLQS